MCLLVGCWGRVRGLLTMWRVSVEIIVLMCSSLLITGWLRQRTRKDDVVSSSVLVAVVLILLTGLFLTVCRLLTYRVVNCVLSLVLGRGSCCGARTWS